MYMIYEKIYIQQYRIGRKYLWEILNFSQMEYLKPVNFYEEIFKDILKKEDYLKPGRLMGLDVSDKYVSLAVSDWKNKTAVPLRALDRQEINMSSMADLILSLNAEFVFKQHLKFILESLNQPPDMSKTVMEKCYAVCALQGYLDCTNKMV
ncbi:hypothetical protein Q3G72_018706 [Acer saccharum]|nr:hypothetical protein Q3G72_018706 [Acer saccharum]